MHLLNLAQIAARLIVFRAQITGQIKFSQFGQNFINHFFYFLHFFGPAGRGFSMLCGPAVTMSVALRKLPMRTGYASFATRGGRHRQPNAGGALGLRRDYPLAEE